MTATSEQLVTYLRAVADFYEQHQEVPLPWWTHDLSLSVYLYPSHDPKAILRSIGSFKKTFDRDRFVARKQIGGGELVFRMERAAVCTPRVIGTTVVAAKFTPECVTPACFTPEYTEEVVEWDCDPVLESEVTGI